MDHQLTKKEMRDFLSSGVDGAKWPKGTIIWTHVEDEENISLQKYVHRRGQGSPHAEIQFINDLTRGGRGRRLVDRAEKIEIFFNYSPCDKCADELLELVSDNPRLSITIKCAKLYRVEQDQKYSEKNIRGLQSLQSAKGIQVRPFNADDWSRLLREASTLQGYDYLQPLEALQFTQAEAEIIFTGRQAADDTTRRKLRQYKREAKCNFY